MPSSNGATRWRGQLPQGDVVVFAAGLHDAYIEVNGPLTGRIVGYDAHEGSNYLWPRLADDLEAFLAWSLEAVRLGGITIEWSEAYRCRPVLLDGGYSSGSKSQLRFEGFIRELHPHVAAAGGTLAYYQIYEEPPGTNPIGYPPRGTMTDLRCSEKLDRCTPREVPDSADACRSRTVLVRHLLSVRSHHPVRGPLDVDRLRGPPPKLSSTPPRPVGWLPIDLDARCLAAGGSFVWRPAGPR